MANLLNSIIFLLFLLQTDTSDGLVYNIANFGAISDGQTDSSNALLSAWTAACQSTEPSTVYVPSAKFLVEHVSFTGPCLSSEITMKLDGTIVAPPSYGSMKEWISFEQIEGISVSGGIFDGSGSSLWACKASGIDCPSGATSLTFRNSKDVLITSLTSINSKLFHIVIENCNSMTLQGIRITAPENSPNTDGIHVQGSNYVTISGSEIRTGDDCISIGPGATNLWIEGVNCGPGHGISIGSLGKDFDERGVENVTVKTTVFTGTQNGLRIKTWGTPNSGFVRDVTFEHSLMTNVQNPIIIDQNYCPSNNGCPNQDSGVKISQVTYNDIQGSSATRVAVKFNCSAINPCSEIGLQDIKLTYLNDELAESQCSFVDGTVSGFVVPPSCVQLLQ